MSYHGVKADIAEFVISLWEGGTDEKLAEELIRYMDSDTANRYLESIAREYKVEDEESED